MPPQPETATWPWKTDEDYFADWENHVFGFGYGTGEEHTLGALKDFMGAVGREGMREEMPNAYDFEKLEAALTPRVAWLMINILASLDVDVIEYGTSPRYGWLTEKGESLKAFVDGHSLEELVAFCTVPRNHCYPDACNCEGYVEGRKCQNSFW